MQVARYELVPISLACVCEVRTGHVRKIIGLVLTKVFNIYSKSNGKMVHWRFLPFFPNDGALGRGSWALFLRLRGHFSAFPFFSGTEACWRSTFSGLFVEDGDGDVTIVHKSLGICGGWRRRGYHCPQKVRETWRMDTEECPMGTGVYREPPGFVLGGDGSVSRIFGFCAWRDGSVSRVFGFCAWRGRHRRRAIARRLRRARVRGALCGGPPPRAAVACGGAGGVFCLGGRLARPGVISRSGPAQKPTPPEDNSAAGL